MGYASAMAWVLLLAIAICHRALLLVLALLGVLWRRSLEPDDPTATRCERTARGAERAAVPGACACTSCCIGLLFVMLYPVIWMVL